jgi:hypothetical protein
MFPSGLIILDVVIIGIGTAILEYPHIPLKFKNLMGF